jgi:hypothetical protein
MTTIGKALATVFREACDAEYYDSTWFKDNDPGGSFIPSLDQLSAAQASESPACGRNTVAGHAAHISFHLQALVDFIRTGVWQERLDWESSWHKQEVTDEEWSALRARLREQATTVHDHIRKMPMDSEEDTLTGAVALVAHCAYHLGAVRQIAACHLKHGR